MELTPVNVIDQIVSWFAIVALELLFISRAADVRRGVMVRVAAGNAIGVAFAMTYFPLCKFAKTMAHVHAEAILVYMWWGIFYLITIFLMRALFRMSCSQIMLRCIMGLCLYSIGTTFVQNFVAGLWFPHLAEEDLLMYVFVDVAVYTLLGIAGYCLIVKRMGAVKTLCGMDEGGNVRFFCVLFVFCNIVWDISNGIFKHAIEPLLYHTEYDYLVANVRYFCAVTSIVFSLFILWVLFLFYRISWMHQEKNMLKYLQGEREKQYEHSKYSMDVINQKCHDLKRQIRALHFSVGDEKEKLYKETQAAADFFDHVVKTDNEMLNTILTEKGLICHNKRIRLTCSVKGCNFESISVIDLYTIFSNALDNAIECVEKYAEEKRIISINLSRVGQMNCILIENYFEGRLKFVDGQLGTSKGDKNYHGFGVKSIRLLAKKYNGDIRISALNNTFSLQIMLSV